MDYQNATNTLRRMALQYQGIVDAADVLEKLGSLDTATKESIAARDAALEARDRAIEAQKQADLDLEAAKSAAEKVVAEAHTEAEAIVAEARDGAARVVADAEALHAEVVGAANREANQAHEQQYVRAALLDEEIKRLYAQAESAAAARDKAVADADAAAAKLAQLQAMIAKIAGSVN